MRIVILTALALLMMAAPATADRLESPDEYSYDRIGKRDPFRSAVVPPGAATQKLFERFELEDLQVSAVILAPDASWAVVEGPAGFHVLVRDGSRFGSDSMRVSKVLPDGLILEDFRFRTADGAPVTLMHTLSLPAEETALPQTPPGP